jgi:hypothetical protein
MNPFLSNQSRYSLNLSKSKFYFIFIVSLFSLLLSQKILAAGASDCVSSMGATTTQGNVSTVCSGTSVTFKSTANITVSSSRVTFSYQLYKDGVAVSGATGSQLTTGAASYPLSITYNVTLTGTYTIVATSKVCGGGNGTSSSGVTVTVNPMPLAPTLNPTSSTICAGSVQMLQANGTQVMDTLSFNANNGPGWSQSNALNAGGLTSFSSINHSGQSGNVNDWSRYDNGYNLPPVFHTNDNSSFLMTVSVPAATTSTILKSPSYNTSGMASATLTFYHSIKFNSASDRSYVEVSADNSTWTTAKTYSSNAGSSAGFILETIDLSSYTGNATLYIRFRYVASQSSWWAIDNINLTGNSIPVSYIWSPAATLYTDAAASTSYSGSSSSTVYAMPSSTTTYTVTASSGAGCQRSSSVVVTVNSQVFITSQPSNFNGCSGVASFSVAATGVALTYQWQVSTDGGITYSNTTDGSTYSGSTTNTLTVNIASGMDTYLYRSIITSSPCTPVPSNAVGLDLTYTWTGATDNNWVQSANWQCAVVPNSIAANVRIPNVANKPVINSGIVSVKDITIETGGAVINNGTINIAGMITNNGTFTSSAGTIIFNGSSAQTIPANAFDQNTIRNLTCSNTAGLTLGGALTITNAFSFGNVNNSTFNTGDLLTLHSDAVNTGMISDITNNGANSGNSISGSVVMERYISSYNNRAYRLLTPSVNTSTSIHQNWQEGGTWRNDNPNPGYGTQITGPSPDQLNGFDATATGQPSLYLFQNNGWAQINNTNTNTLSAKTGYLIFIRGDRTYDLDQPQTGVFISQNTTLRAKGNILTGQQDFTGLAGNGAQSLVTNPYPAPIDWSKVYALASNANNFENYITMWDPNIGTRGGYVTVTNAGIVSNVESNASTQIQSGIAFFLTAKSGASSPVFSVKEQHKGSANNLNVFLPIEQQPRMDVLLYFNDPYGVRKVADGVSALYDDSYSSAVDQNDAVQLSNMDEDIAYLRQGKKLSIETRPLITSPDTLFIFMTRMKTQAYEWDLKAQLFAQGVSAELVDNYTGIRTQLDLNNTTTVGFTCTADPASKAIDRFYIVYNPSGALPVLLSSIRGYQYNTGVNIDWAVTQQINMERYEIERSVTGMNFSHAAIVAANAYSSAASYTWFDANPVMGANFYRIKMIDKSGAYSYSSVVKVVINRSNEPGVTIYPNPVIGSNVTLQMIDLEKGNYTLTVTNNAGQTVMNQTLMHSGGSATQTIHFDKGLAQGSYQMTLHSDNLTFTLPFIKQ